jgi:hypothetical protein
MTPSDRKFSAAELVPGRVYRVVKAFKDYGNIPHPVGEIWRYEAKNFLPYEDGLTLFVVRDGNRELINLQWREETQGQIIDDFYSFVEEI